MGALLGLDAPLAFPFTRLSDPGFVGLGAYLQGFQVLGDGSLQGALADRSVVSF